MEKGYKTEGSDWLNSQVMSPEDQRKLIGNLMGEALGLAGPQISQRTELFQGTDAWTRKSLVGRLWLSLGYSVSSV